MIRGEAFGIVTPEPDGRRFRAGLGLLCAPLLPDIPKSFYQGMDGDIARQRPI